MNIVVGVSDAKTSADPGAVLATFALGSCVGVSLYDPVMRIGGLLHFQLPSSADNPERAREKPLMFADTGMAWLLAEMTRLGGDKRRIKVRLVGAAQMLNDSNMFDIGRRNHAAIRKILWKHGMFIESEHIGGSTPRTMYLGIVDGSLTIKQHNETVTV